MDNQDNELSKLLVWMAMRAGITLKEAKLSLDRVGDKQKLIEVLRDYKAFVVAYDALNRK